MAFQLWITEEVDFLMFGAAYIAMQIQQVQSGLRAVLH